MLRLNTHHKLLVVFLFVLTISVLSSGKVRAASIDVATGNDETTANSKCSLSEAITNINNGNATTYPECTGTGAFGSDDTINLPAGIITLIADLPDITEPVTLQGQGMGVSVIDGDQGSYNGITSYAATDAFELTVRAFRTSGIHIFDSNAVFDQVEVDGESDVPGGYSEAINDGIDFNNQTAQDIQLMVSNIYVHHLRLVNPVSAINGFRIQGGDTAAAGSINATVRNVTVSDIYTNALSLQPFVVVGSPPGPTGGHTIDVLAENITVSNIEGTQTISGIGMLSVASTINLRINNSTVTNIRGSTGPYGNSAGIGAAGVGSSTSGNIRLANVVIADALQDGDSINCGLSDLTATFGGSGTPNLTISSVGGNLSDDTTCSSYFTQLTDQNNITYLRDSLAPLSFNGGYVPTIPLLQGSPAIDSGVTIAGLITDARGAARPQGSAYDSGAYESPYTKPVTSLAGTGQNTALFTAIATSMLTLATGVIVLRRQHFN